MDLQLGNVQYTAIIPLAIKASESMRPKARFHDARAEEIIKKLGIDIAPFDKFLSHEGVVARTIMLDRQLSDIIKKNPDTVVVNLGAGFDSRFERLDNGQITWFDVDFPDTIEARKKLFPENERNILLVGSVLMNDWCAEVKKAIEKSSSKPVFIAEGLFMYLTMDQIKGALQVLLDNFETGTLIAEQNTPLMVKHSKQHDTVKNTNAEFMSGTDSAKEIEALVDGIHLVEEHSFNEEMRKHSVRGKLFATFCGKFNDRWATFRW